MKKTIYCKTVSKGMQAFYLKLENKEYFLFVQKYYRGVRDFFSRGRDLSELSTASSYHNMAVRRTATKLPSYLKYMEKELGVVIYDKKDRKKFNPRQYSRSVAQTKARQAMGEYYIDKEENLYA
ncbi:MAG: hypothetical protein E7353_02340 [Clostridiales bacterium]|nr:hypothetical protein [Clostridiales bacterium]